MTILINLANWRNVLQQCCAALVAADRLDDAEQLWQAAQTARDAREIVMHLPADVTPEYVWEAA